MYPIFDVHLGARACDEAKLKSYIERVKNDDDGYWIGGGDYIEAVNSSDKRFDPRCIADWIHPHDYRNIARVQADRFLDMVRPIAGKCIGLLEGNHEEKIRSFYEHDIYGHIVSAIKKDAGMDDVDQLGLNYSGWLQLKFAAAGHERYTINMRLHHGYGGGSKPGAAANRMRDFILTNDCEIALMGHCHRLTADDPVIVDTVNAAGVVKPRVRRGAFCGSYLNSHHQAENPDTSFHTYSERAGYPPLCTGGLVIELKPGTRDPMQRVRIMV